MRGMTSLRLADQLVTTGLSTVGASGSSAWAGFGSPSEVAMMTCSNCLPPSPSAEDEEVEEGAAGAPFSLGSSGPGDEDVRRPSVSRITVVHGPDRSAGRG